MKRFEDIFKLDIGMGSCREDYEFLYGFVALLRPKIVLEIGTNHGVGTITMALALKENNISGHIYTFDVIPDCIKKAIKQIINIGVEDSITIYNRTMFNIKELRFKNKEIDLAFIDGDHTYEGVKKDFEEVKDLSKYVLFHDSNACGGVRKFVEELEGEKVRIMNRPQGSLFNGDINGCFNGITIYKGE